MRLCAGWILASYVYSNVYLRSVLIVEGTVRAMGEITQFHWHRLRAQASQLLLRKRQFSGASLCHVLGYVSDNCKNLN